MINLADELPRLLPLAIAWAQAREIDVLTNGGTLSDFERRLAVAVGVQQPDRVRIRVVDKIPEPDIPELRAIAAETKLIGPWTGGITFGHGIYIRSGQVADRLVSHELRHVHQYEAFGSIAAFLTIYLEQIATVGYDRTPLELDARQHEREKP